MSTTPVVALSCKFTGKERDTETGLDYFGARYYGSNMGRFQTPDPLPWIHWQHGNEDAQRQFEAYIANPQKFNMYAYVRNNPLNHTDPTGMNACGTKDDSSCKVTVTIQDRTKDAQGHYNDGYTGVANQQNYHATEERLRRIRSGLPTSSPCWVLRRDVRVRALRLTVLIRIQGWVRYSASRTTDLRPGENQPQSSRVLCRYWTAENPVETGLLGLGSEKIPPNDRKTALGTILRSPVPPKYHHFRRSFRTFWQE